MAHPTGGNTAQPRCGTTQQGLGALSPVQGGEPQLLGKARAPSFYWTLSGVPMAFLHRDGRRDCALMLDRGL